MMFGDVGHGAVLVVGGLVALLKSRVPRIRDFGILFVFNGLSSALFGVVYGNAENVAPWWELQAPDWSELRTEALTLLQREERLQQVVRLVGPDVLPDSQRLILFIAEILKDGFLAQSAYDDKDTFCAPERQVALLRLILTLYRRGRDLVETGVPLARVRALACVPKVLQAKEAFGNNEQPQLAELERRVNQELDALAKPSAQEGTKDA